MVVFLRPFTARLRRLARRGAPEFFASATETWQVGPAETMHYLPSRALPGQVERIRASVFAPLPDTIEALTRRGDTHEGPTTAWRLRGVDLVDGVLYHGGAEYHLRPRQRRFGLTPRPRTEASGTLYESWTTNRWFGSWLMDATLTYELAEAQGSPVSISAARPPGSHQHDYERLIGMTPGRVEADVHFTDLVMFGDLANNGHKAARARALRRRLLAGRDPKPVPGVFLLRGDAGDRRVLVNERDLAECLAAERGFRVIDPLQATVEQLIEACGAARIIVGVEGSHLVHGITVAPEGAAIIPIQPPLRVAATLKQMTDRLGQHYGLLVAEGGDIEFRLSRDDLFATIDLFD
ncbi:glycosyltransferase family 61 protein [Paracoccus salsus]|uniref:glycosyltransferase family 61 protein n=1 Tax=Paracoccus salsus TaxID=2911061 RepID=UPI001F25D36D|nr:glycosyltransferase family 61 protein [Paracoccus salsus]MCF3974256.1 glycosyltransferase family 61 protein [Paracoccus salsus]